MSFNLGGKLSLQASDFVSGMKKASKSTEELEKQLKDLKTTKIELKADAKQARTEISDLHSELTKVEGREARAKVTADISDAQDDLDRIESDIRSVDGEIVRIEIEADSSGLDSAVSKLEGMPGQLGEVGDALSGIMTGPAGIVAGVGALGAAALQLADNAAAIAIEAQTYADLTGSTVEDASRLLTVTKQVGIEATDLSDITLQTVQGLRDNAEFAKKLGINLKDGKNPAERLVQVLDLMNSGMVSANDKAEIFGALLGEEGVRQGQQLATQIGDISAAVEEVPEINVITDEEAADAIEYQEAMNELKVAMQGIAITVGQELAPALADVAESLADVAGLVGIIADSPLVDFTKAIDEWINPLSLASKAADGMADGWDRAFGADITGAISIQADELDLLTAEYQRNAVAIEDVTDAAEDEAVAVANAARSQKLAKQRADEWTASNRTLEQSIQDIIDAEREQVDPIFAAMRATERHTEALEALNAENGNTVENQRAVVEASQDMEAAMLAVGLSADSSADDLIQFGIDAGLTEAQAWELAAAMLGTAENADKVAGKRVAELEADDQASEVIEQVQRRANALDGTVSYIDIITRRSEIVLGDNRHTGRAAGGPVAGGQTYLVGERGPELFTAPSGGGEILTAQATSAMSTANMAGPSGGGVATGTQSTSRFVPGSPLTNVFIDGRELEGTVTTVVNNRNEIEVLMR